jgi:thiol:disulfide interchange protein DsbA
MWAKKGVDMVNRQCAQWTSAVCAIVWSVAVLWGSPATAAPPELKGKFEILKDEVSTHTPGKVKLVEFADFYCPHCHQFEETGLPLLVKEFGNKLEITMVGYPVIRGKLPTAFDMYEQAKMMGKGNEMRKVLFRTIHKDKIDGVLDRSIRSVLIKEVGLDETVFEAGMQSGKPAKAFEEGKRWGERINVSSTPSVLLDGNIKVDGANMTPENVITIIRSILENDAKK